MTKNFRVAAKSRNHNSFGLYGYVLIAPDGEAWEVGRSLSASPEWTVGNDVSAFCDEDGQPTFPYCEIPHQLPQAPQKVLTEVYPTPPVRDIVSTIRPGDRVTISTPHGSKLTGRATIFNREKHLWVLNGGGRYGTALIADNDNILKVKP